MMYSHSKISTFFSCPKKFKFQYIDRVPSAFTSIEGYPGNLVHKTMEKLYRDLKDHRRKTSLEELLSFYETTWHKGFDGDKVRIVKRQFDQAHYLELGRRYLTEYYTRYHPFTHVSVEHLEYAGRTILAEGSIFLSRIDKVCTDGRKIFVVDYKTAGSKQMTQNEADEDRQLSMYALSLLNDYPNAEFMLIWHLLPFNSVLSSSRTMDQLRAAEEEVISQIRQVESATEHPARPSGLCPYCGYVEECGPRRRTKSGKESLFASGLRDNMKLVDEYVRLLEDRSSLEKKLSQSREELLALARKSNVEKLLGSQCSVSIRDGKAIEVIGQ